MMLLHHFAWLLNADSLSEQVPPNFLVQYGKHFCPNILLLI